MKVSSSYLVQVDSELDAKVTFSLVKLPDDDYNIEVASMFFQDLDGLQVLLSEYHHHDQRALLDAANEAVDSFINKNHEKIYKDLTSVSTLDKNNMH